MPAGVTGVHDTHFSPAHSFEGQVPGGMKSHITWVYSVNIPKCANVLSDVIYSLSKLANPWCFSIRSEVDITLLKVWLFSKLFKIGPCFYSHYVL